MRFYEKLIINILNKGAVPKHIAFIMDGNRRYAVSHGKKKFEGHGSGFESLKKTLSWCLELGVKEVSIFAFSIDNFQRDKEEVEVLMELARDKLKEISENNEFLQKNGVKTSIIGNLDLLPQDVKETMYLVMKRTEKNTNLQLNICFSYDFTYEIERAITLYHKDKENKEKSKQEVEAEEARIAREILNKYMLIKTEPDILVRTSNEIRFSNFMLSQCSSSMLCFLKENWPEMSIFSMLKIILQYQMQEKSLKQLRAHLDDYERKDVLEKKKSVSAAS